MTAKELTIKMQNGEIDPNNQSLFFRILIKGLLYDLKDCLSIRGKSVPHFIPHTGDETMMLELKGYDESISPIEQTGENYIYTIVPRAAVEPKGISLLPDQMTSPYARGVFQYEDEDNLMTFTSEFRRMPLKMSFDITYIIDTFTDMLELIQQITTRLCFIRTFSITYMGQVIKCSYNIPDSLDGENTLDFDQDSTEDRRRKLSISIEVESCIPVFNGKAAIPTDSYIRTTGMYGHNDKAVYQESFKIYPTGGIEKDPNNFERP